MSDHDDGRMMHDLAKLNSAIARYILAHLDADTGRTSPVSTEDELLLASGMVTAAKRLEQRALARLTPELADNR